MFITPAMASEPYWAAAPSRSTSIRSIAAAGIAFRSTPTVPRPNVPLTCTNALEWRRLPLTRTSTWSETRRAYAELAGRAAQAVLCLLVVELAARRLHAHDARPDRRRALGGCHLGPRDGTGLLCE